MDKPAQSPSKLVASGRVKVIFSEDGSVMYLDIDGSVYEGVGDTVPVPLWRLRRLKLKEIPQGVFIEPVEMVRENIVYTPRYTSKLFFAVRIGRGLGVAELYEWAQTWEGFIGFYAYMEALSTVLEELEDAGYIGGLSADLVEDGVHLSFSVNLPENFTVFKAMRVMKGILSEIEREADYRAALLAYREAKKILRSTSRRRREGVLERLDELYGKYSL